MLNYILMTTCLFAAHSAAAMTSDHLGNGQRAELSQSAMCDVRDRVYHPQQYVLGPSKWNKSRLSFRIVNSPASLSDREVRQSISDAFHVWSDASRLSFHELRSGRADITVQFLTGFHGDGFPFDGPGKIVAHAFFPDDERGGNVHFDAEENWTVSATNGLNLFMVAAHEIGHVLGLAHSTVPRSLMSPWHRHFHTDFVLPDDDVAAIQQLYGAPDSTIRRVFAAPTAARPSTTTASSTSATAAEAAVSLTSADPSRTSSSLASYPDPCRTSLDAISIIRGQLIAFKSNWFWRLGPGDQTHHSWSVEPPKPEPLKQFWSGLPPELKKVDAVFERPSDRRIFIFSGEKYWELSDRQVLRRFGRRRPLSHLGLPPHITSVDAAFVWGHHRRIYLVTGRTYWRLDKSGQFVLLHGYPRDVPGVWAGVKLPIDAAFTNTDGRTYFFSGDQYWQFNDARMRVARGYPKPIGQWFGCARQQASSSQRHDVSRSSHLSPAASVTVLLSLTHAVYTARSSDRLLITWIY